MDLPAGELHGPVIAKGVTQGVTAAACAFSHNHAHSLPFASSVAPPHVAVRMLPFPLFPAHHIPWQQRIGVGILCTLTPPCHSHVTFHSPPCFSHFVGNSCMNIHLTSKLHFKALFQYFASVHVESVGGQALNMLLVHLALPKNISRTGLGLQTLRH